MNITSLSRSMVNTYQQCPYKFYCQYCLKLPRRSNMALAFGASFHKTTEENFWQKVRTQKDLPVALLTDFFAENLECRDDVDWKEQEQTLDQTKDDGVKMVRAYQQKIAPGIQPKLVEHAWTMEVNNRDWMIAGKTDLITIDDDVYELKTTGRRLSKPREEHVSQVATYVMARRAQTGLESLQGWLDYAIRGKDEVISMPVSFNGDLSQRIVSEFDNAAGWIQREAWPHFRSHYLCSRKYCAFWEQCEKDCGGTVAH